MLIWSMEITSGKGTKELLLIGYIIIIIFSNIM